MTDERFNKLTVGGIVIGFLLIAFGVAVRFLEEWLSDILNVESIHFLSSPLIYFGIILVIIFFAVYLLEEFIVNAS